jgi:hypothetical protein
MKISLIIGFIAAACLVSYSQQPAAPKAAGQTQAAPAQLATPSIESVDPPNGKVGTVITATGQNLQKTNVAKLYLTDNTNDLQVDVTEQTATSIKFKIPDKAAGRMSLMILTSDKDPKLMVLPVKVTIND